MHIYLTPGVGEDKKNSWKEIAWFGLIPFFSLYISAAWHNVCGIQAANREGRNIRRENGGRTSQEFLSDFRVVLGTQMGFQTVE